MTKRRILLVVLMLCFGLIAPASAIAAATELHFFYAENCPVCRQEKPFVEELQRRYPELKVRIHDVWQERDSYELMMALARAQGVEIATTPATAVGRHAWFGFNDRIAREIETAVAKCVAEGCPDLVAALAVGQSSSPPAGLAGDEPLPLDPENYYLPVFTVLLGLLDSFNPCAFFVLLFLLSLMVHTRSRKRMFLVGGVFIFFSGLIYFFFMAAWLNLFLLAGQLPLLTTFAGLLALIFALFNIKDHFYFHQGPTLSISEKAKPKLMARIRNLLKGHRLLPILGGTVVLALVANSYELLCTAGFPMVYTRVLTLRELPDWLYYMYLGLYNLAYVVPLLIIVILFALTLGSYKMSEFAGRVLKLMSGMMMLILGLILLWNPVLLQNLPAVMALLIAALAGTGVVLLVERWVKGRWQ
jgi:thiol-disulfide isomerase/thioredoxin